MQTVMSARDFACWHYGIEEPSAAQVNTVTEMCRNGTIRHTEKIGRTWYINCTREWPELFPEVREVEGKSFGDLLIELGTMLKEVEHEWKRSGAA